MQIDLSPLIDALNRNTEALLKVGGTVTSTAGETKTEKATKTEKGTKTEKATKTDLTQDQVNAALLKIKDDFGAEHAKAIITEYGKCERMADIKAVNYQAVYDAAIAKHAELSGAGSDGGL